MPYYELVDGEQRAAEAPLTFHIPSFEERNDVAEGAYCKIGFIVSALEKVLNGKTIDVERMWVKVYAREGQGVYYGKLANDPAITRLIKINDDIQFEPKNILAIMPPDK
jgi:hypothetical protein